MVSPAFSDMTDAELKRIVQSAPQWPNGIYDKIPGHFDHTAAENARNAQAELDRRPAPDTEADR